MKINGMEQFQHRCRLLLTAWFNINRGTQIMIDDTYVVWSCKALQNYKCLCSTNVDGDTTYAEYTFNGDKGQLYCDYYTKEANIALE